MLKNLLSLVCICMFAIFSVAGAANAIAPDTNKPPQLMSARQQLDVEKARNKLLAKKLETLAQNKEKLVTAPIDGKVLHRAEVMLALIKADLDGIDITLSAAEQTVALTLNNIESIQGLLRDATALSNVSSQEQTQLSNQLKYQQELLNLQQARVKVLLQTQNLAQNALLLAQEWQAQARLKYQLFQQQSRQQALDKVATTLQAEQQKWLARLATLNQRLQLTSAENLVSGPTYEQIEMGIFEAEEHSNIIQVQFDFARLHSRFEDLTPSPGPTPSLSVLTSTQKQIDTLADQVKNIADMLRNKINLIQKRIKIVTQSKDSGMLLPEEAQANLNLLYALQASYQKQLVDAVQFSDQIQKYQAELSQQLGKQIGVRQGLPGFSLQEWSSLSQKLQQIPTLTWQTLRNLEKTFVSTLNDARPTQWLIWLIALTAWGLLGSKLRRLLSVAISHIEKRNQDDFLTQVLIACSKLAYSHLPVLFILGGFIGLLLMMGLSLQLFSLVIELALVCLVFSLLIGLARLSLLESIIHKEGSDVKLYHRLKWVLRMGGLLTLLMVLVHQLPVPYDIQDLFSRLFMLFLLVMVLVWIRSLEVVPALLEPYLERRHPYLKQIVRWLNLLIPLSIFSNSVIGLIGYVELAWDIAAYQGLFLIVFTGYLLARGLLAELMRYFSELVIRWFRNGWLWSEAFLKPLHQVLKILLLLEAVHVLFNLYGWGNTSVVVTAIKQFLNLHLITVAESVITPWTLIELLIIIAIILWAARWVREFSYRWLYAGTKDLGLRNSLAVFTQYTVVAIGSLLALRVVGISLTALTVIASAFAFGIGLGLRDLANNFMCGILLLIERPIQVGDYITVSNSEGVVVHIGMRSITITTDDHKEFLVPNSEIFSKSFINWTHRDNIIRVLFSLHINREDDVHRVRNIILEVLRSVPIVLASPPPEVYFEKMTEMLLEFHVEYFMDHRKYPSKSAVHSKVLFTLWDRFKVEGIHPPEFPHELYIKGELAGLPAAAATSQPT